MEESILPENVQIGDHVIAYGLDDQPRTNGEVVGRTATGYLIVLGDGKTGDVKRRPYRAHRWVLTQAADPVHRDVRATMTRAAEALTTLSNSHKVTGFEMAAQLRVLSIAVADLVEAAEDAAQQRPPAVARALAAADQRLRKLEGR